MEDLRNDLTNLKNERDDLQEALNEVEEEKYRLLEDTGEKHELKQQIKKLNQENQKVEELEQDKRQLDFKISQMLRQQEQHQIINELLNQIQTNRADVEHNKSHARDQESMFIKQQSSKIEEINDLRELLSNAQADKDDLVDENLLLKQRITALESQVQILGHLTGGNENQERGPQLDGRIQSLLDRIHSEGISILALSEAQALRGDTDIAQHRAESLSRRAEVELEQVIINSSSSRSI